MMAGGDGTSLFSSTLSLLTSILMDEAEMFLRGGLSCCPDPSAPSLLPALMGVWFPFSAMCVLPTVCTRTVVCLPVSMVMSEVAGGSEHLVVFSAALKPPLSPALVGVASLAFRGSLNFAAGLVTSGLVTSGSSAVSFATSVCLDASVVGVCSFWKLAPRDLLFLSCLTSFTTSSNLAAGSTLFSLATGSILLSLATGSTLLSLVTDSTLGSILLSLTTGSTLLSLVTDSTLVSLTTGSIFTTGSNLVSLTTGSTLVSFTSETLGFSKAVCNEAPDLPKVRIILSGDEVVNQSFEDSVFGDPSIPHSGGMLFSPWGAVFSPWRAVFSPWGAVFSPWGAVFPPWGAVFSPWGTCSLSFAASTLFFRSGDSTHSLALTGPVLLTLASDPGISARVLASFRRLYFSNFSSVLGS